MNDQQLSSHNALHRQRLAFRDLCGRVQEAHSLGTKELCSLFHGLNQNVQLFASILAHFEVGRIEMCEFLWVSFNPAYVVFAQNFHLYDHLFKDWLWGSESP